jgi:hypothetical protein
LPVWVKPLTTAYKPLDDHHLEMRIKALAAWCGVTNIPVLVDGNSTGVDGLGPTHRIYLRTNLASVESPDQIEFTIGHELKHYVMGDNRTALAYLAVSLAPDWGTFFLVFQADHPSIRTRIEFADSYKPWELGVPLVYGNVCESE